MVLLTREATNRSRDGFRLFYFYKSRYGLRYFSALPYSLDIEPPDARGAAASKNIKKTREGGGHRAEIYTCFMKMFSHSMAYKCWILYLARVVPTSNGQTFSLLILNYIRGSLV